jgi:outer membrane biosynthesis protein TonB
MSEPSGRDRQGNQGPSATSWEDRAAGLASEVQRWLIRTSAKTMRDELGGQVKKAFRGQEPPSADDVWSTVTTEPPSAVGEAPECAWCPVCRAARRLAQARIAAGTDGRSGAATSDLGDVVTGAIRDVLGGIDSVLSYRPGEPEPKPNSASNAESTPEPGPDTDSEPEPEPAAVPEPQAASAPAAASGPEPEMASEPVPEETSAASPGAQRAEEPEDEPGHRS